MQSNPPDTSLPIGQTQQPKAPGLTGLGRWRQTAHRPPGLPQVGAASGSSGSTVPVLSAGSAAVSLPAASCNTCSAAHYSSHLFLHHSAKHCTLHLSLLSQCSTLHTTPFPFITVQHIKHHTFPFYHSAAHYTPHLSLLSQCNVITHHTFPFYHSATHYTPHLSSQCSTLHTTPFPSITVQHITHHTFSFYHSATHYTPHLLSQCSTLHTTPFPSITVQHITHHTFSFYHSATHCTPHLLSQCSTLLTTPFITVQHITHHTFYHSAAHYTPHLLSQCSTLLTTPCTRIQCRFQKAKNTILNRHCTSKRLQDLQVLLKIQNWAYSRLENK